MAYWRSLAPSICSTPNKGSFRTSDVICWHAVKDCGRLTSLRVEGNFSSFNYVFVAHKFTLLLARLYFPLGRAGENAEQDHFCYVARPIHCLSSRVVRRSSHTVARTEGGCCLLRPEPRDHFGSTNVANSVVAEMASNIRASKRAKKGALIKDYNNNGVCDHIDIA